MKRTGRRVLAAVFCWLLSGTVILNMAGCSAKVKAENLMKGITPETVAAAEDLTAQNEKVTDFAVRLFQASAENGKNTLLSPLSVLCALAMTANGAEGETRSQMETVLGMSAEELNLYLYSYRQNLPQDEKAKLSLANSVWFTEDGRFTVNRDFLQTNADYYGADIYRAPFDSRTCRDINNWVRQKTNGMIPEILDEVPPDAILYLVNALAFEGEWTKFYEENQVREGVFTKEDGSGQKAEFMYGTEYSYLENGNATGFLKYYKGGQYAFAALLPKEGVSLAELIESLNGESLYQLLKNPASASVYTAIPKFETEYDVEMAGILKTMGMPNAFDSDAAEFERLGSSTDGNLYISRVLHKTFLSMGEKGTRAGAATVVEVRDEASYVEPEEIKEVTLDRPFVYMLIDRENRVPFFIGSMTDLTA